MYPLAGSTCAPTANATTRMIPTTKAGSVDTAEHASVTPRSTQPPRRTAATVPAVPPIRTARMIAPMAIERSTGSRWAMLCDTGIWVK